MPSAYVRPGTVAQIKDLLDQVYNKSLQIFGLFKIESLYAIGTYLRCEAPYAVQKGACL